MVVEGVAGVVFGSLALLADAAHMLSDGAAMAVALLAHSLSTRPSSSRHSFGLQRAEVLGAQANGILLVAAAGWILVEAARRLGDVPTVDGAGVVAVGTAGLAANLAAAAIVARAGGRTLNLRALRLHLAADAAGSAATIVAGGAVIIAGASWVDPLASIVIGLLVLVSAWRLLRDTTHVLLEGTPPHLRPSDVMDAMRATAGVREVHHLHLWSLASDVPALSAHVVLDDDLSLHDAQEIGADLRRLLAALFGIGHATLDLECHRCESPPEHAGVAPPTRRSPGQRM